jgi:glycosyltransferase involved in cell wall biosynthesis
VSQTLVTVSIPTRNSGRSLRTCLEAVSVQTYPHLDVHVVDGNSSDATVEIAQGYGVDVILHTGSLLGARREGALRARGDLTLLLDSDQVLEHDAIERAVEQIEMEGLDMLVFGEDVYRPASWLGRLFRLDRRLIHAVCDLSPFTGVMLPRLFRTAILRQAFANIPDHILRTVSGQDHAIIYYEAWLISKRVGVLPGAVGHIEPASVFELAEKFYRWGATSVDARDGPYRELFSRKERFRTGLFSRGHLKESLGSIALLVLKGVPFTIGRAIATSRRRWRTPPRGAGETPPNAIEQTPEAAISSDERGRDG